jgi:hypothetical protein
VVDLGSHQAGTVPSSSSPANPTHSSFRCSYSGLSSDLGPYALRPPEGWNNPAVEVTAEDAAARLDWLRGEVGRFNRFVALQLDQIRRSREEMARTDAQVTAAFVTREQEMNREKASLAARAAAVDKREADRAAEHAALRATLERRLAEVEPLEATTLRKLEEVEEIEEALRTELETREREVELQRREVEAARQLRSHPPAPTPADDGPGAMDLLGSWHCG